MTKQLKVIRTIKQLAALPIEKRRALLHPNPKHENYHPNDRASYIFSYSIVHEDVQYQLDWAALAKQLAPELGVRGEPGGWIYRLTGGDGQWKNTPQGSRPICQGWVAYAKTWHPTIALKAHKACGDHDDYR